MDVVELTRRLIQAPSLSGDERAAADVALAAMNELGFDHVTRDEYGSIVGRIGPAEGPAALLFDGHIDVVPAIGEWSVDPFSGEVRDGRIYGRGATDMKGPIAAAMCGVAAAAKEGLLKRQVIVSASVMEELVEGAALASILDRWTPEAVVICEASELELRVGQRGRIEITLELHGKPAHASMPHLGKNPIEAAARALSAIDTIEYLNEPLLGMGVLAAVSIISDPLPSPSTIPMKTTICFDRRTVSGETRETVFGQIRDALTSNGIKDFTLSCPNDPLNTYTGLTVKTERNFPSWSISTSHPLVEKGLSALKAADLPARTGTWVCCTNGSESAGRRRIPTIGVGPGKMSDAHTINESIEVAQLKKAVEIYRNLTRSIAG